VEFKDTHSHRQAPLVPFNTTPLTNTQNFPKPGNRYTFKIPHMKKIFQRIDRIRGSGSATLNLERSSPYYHLNGRRFPVHSIGTPDIKCRITLMVDGQPMDFTIEQIL